MTVGMVKSLYPRRPKNDILLACSSFRENRQQLNPLNHRFQLLLDSGQPAFPQAESAERTRYTATSRHSAVIFCHVITTSIIIDVVRHKITSFFVTHHLPPDMKPLPPLPLLPNSYPPVFRLRSVKVPQNHSSLNLDNPSP